MDLCLHLSEYVWYELQNIDEVFEVGREQEHCLAERCHYHDDFEAGSLRIFACYNRCYSDYNLVLFAITMDGILIEMGGHKSGVPPQQHVEAALAFVRHQPVNGVWDVDGNLHEAGIVNVNGEWINIRELPEGTVVNHTLNLNNINTCHELPANLTIHGDLKICKTQIAKLPEGLVVDGVIDTRYTFIHEPQRAK